MIGPQRLIPPLGKVIQLGFVVADLERAVETFGRLTGLGPWHVHTLEAPSLRDRLYRGSPANFSMRVALATDAGGLMYELIQPLSGPSVYDGHVNPARPTLHHVAVQIDGPLAAVVNQFAGRGAAAAMTGKWNKVTFAYFDTVDELGLYIEAWEMPYGYALPSPERVIPETRLHEEVQIKSFGLLGGHS